MNSSSRFNVWMLWGIGCVAGLLALPPARAEQPADRSESRSPQEAVSDVALVFNADERAADARLRPLRTLNDAYHPWSPSETKEQWEQEAEELRRRILVSNGLWPLPPREELKPVVYGKIDRGDYTIEKVYFSSYPGHYVTGNLYRPTKVEGQAPGILCPHGHWPNGRFYDAGLGGARAQLDQSAEKYMSGARYPLQARMVHLARMGCIVFHYDMVGYADSRPIDHRSGFTDVEAVLRLQNTMGLQTYNSIRALDFLMSLPDVDSDRIGVTGASGGGTQTFLLCAIDPRPHVAFPAVMVSTAMQGGCVCENADYLRIGVNNIAFAALFAPKPMAMSGADDWTIDIETKGLPELRQVYSLYGQADLIQAKSFPQFKHNYNAVAREMMYGWFNAHLKLGLEEPPVEGDFWPATAEELRVFGGEHPVPDDAKSVDELKQTMTEVAGRQWKDVLDSVADDLAEYRRIVGGAARILLDRGVPASEELEVTLNAVTLDGGVTLTKGTIGRKQAEEQVPFLALRPESPNGKAVLWIDDSGKSHLFDESGRPAAAVRQLLDQGFVVASADVLGTGELTPAGGDALPISSVNTTYSGYTFGYNRPLLSERVRDILTAISAVRQLPGIRSVELVGTNGAGPWCLLASGLARDQIGRTIADANGFSFSRIESLSDPMLLPGALKYGGLGGLTALAVPTPLVVAGSDQIAPEDRQPLETIYAARKAPLTLDENRLNPERVAEWLLRR